MNLQASAGPGSTLLVASSTLDGLASLHMLKTVLVSEPPMGSVAFVSQIVDDVGELRDVMYAYAAGPQGCML